MIDKMTVTSSSMVMKSNAGNNIVNPKDSGVIPNVIEQLENQTANVQSKEQVEKAVDSMNQFLTASNTHLKFEFHEELKEYYVTVVDSINEEVIKEIPSKKMLDMYASMMSKVLGIIVDQKI